MLPSSSQDGKEEDTDLSDHGREEQTGEEGSPTRSNIYIYLSLSQGDFQQKKVRGDEKGLRALSALRL